MKYHCSENLGHKKLPHVALRTFLAMWTPASDLVLYSFLQNIINNL